MLGGAGTACFAGDERREPKRVEGGREGEGTDLTVPPPHILGCCCYSRTRWDLEQSKPQTGTIAISLALPLPDGIALSSSRKA